MTCPKCNFSCDFATQNIYFGSIESDEFYCPNCGISLTTLNHNINCNHYAKCQQEEILGNEMNPKRQDVNRLCWMIPFGTKKSFQYTNKPWINLNELNF